MRPYISRIDKVIITAMEIIHELGIKALSTKEICKRQGISEGSLYKHFNSKNNILLEVLRYFSRYDQLIQESIKQKGLSPREGIVYFITRFAENYESEPALTAIFNSYETFKNEPFLTIEIKEIFEFRFSLLKNLITEGKEVGEFDSSIDSDCLADIIMGSFQYVTLKWRMRNYNFSLKEELISVNESILSSFSVKTKQGVIIKA